MPTRTDIAISGLAGLSLLILPFFPEKTLTTNNPAHSRNHALSLETRQETPVIFWLDQMSGILVPVLASASAEDQDTNAKTIQYAWAWPE